MKKIICFTGPMLSGKSTTMQELIKLIPSKYEWETIKFADTLYRLQRLIYQEIGRPEPQIKDRKLLQFLGTDFGRAIDPNLWVELWQKNIDKSTCDFILVDDCRFENEAAAVKKLGGVIIKITTSDNERAKRGRIENPNHQSENGIPENYIDYTISNDGTREDLKNNLSSIFTRITCGEF